jgi:diguanylate cyclase (GGDEF)-like protein/PAS domain S-box-containing protein
MEKQNLSSNGILQMAILDTLPNPVLVKDAQLRYRFINKAFEDLFSIRREDVIGKLDQDLFKDRQVSQCNGGDLRVLERGEIDEAYETVLRANCEPRETITRKSRLTLPDGQVLVVGIMHDITEVTTINRKLEENQHLLKQQSEALERMANTDPLTGCSNRRAFSAKTPDAFQKNGNAGSLLLMDIDHFKHINDIYGHDVGDAVLLHFTQTIRQVIRAEDDLVRLGGEEFAVVLAGTSAEESRHAAERIRQAVASTPMPHGNESIVVTVSIGAARAVEQNPLNLTALLMEADRCLYEAKSQGRNRVVYAQSLQPAT